MSQDENVATESDQSALDERSESSLPWKVFGVTALLAAAVGWAFHPSFATLFDRWASDDNYSYGWFVIPIAIAILWERRDRLDSPDMTPRWWGMIPLLGLLLLRYRLYESNEQWVEMAMIPVVIAACVLAICGLRILWWSLPAILFLFFMIPFPPRFNNLLADPLQTIATMGSVTLLQVLALPVISEGNVIIVGAERLEVARACNGLSMLLSFTTLITAMVILIRRPLWERIVLLLSIIPIALACNILRITATAIIYHWTGREVETVHDYAGYAMMPLALAMVLMEMKVMSWMVIEVEIEKQGVIRTTYAPPRPTAS